ncbi:histidine phosphatase family protein [Komagataeibacter rhaeticus]|uniref:Phosphoglycerate mutase n=1 Tax=Komagataeibacter rhaeticus TaxID=215221 RepID=A0A181CCQ6_9PROT|nr:histidine phosphatase family protein [Komagataeibacter rhaeticus]ATU71842.1 phosphoglycerate mutase [Komagataeibacter xylinus]QIP36035.1 phosphoglycerate mutase [Komagataeibacter rhaeticus]QOC45795.1 histidine phosphatase family protein [Komagataeibacter rhaeticus]WPP21539.1 histidine phosphatase family protein [Komagataeibacter rhaeticus]SAY49340.1 Putative phosphoserine phosphatase 2 [Komagataeibacter rhaeticus]
MTDRFAIVLARHPAVMGVEGLCYGQRDVALADGWERMADGLRTVMQGVGCRILFSSPARRCRMVAERVAQFMNLELRVDSRLREISFGEWEGRPWNRISRTALDAWAADVSGFTPPGGESGGALRARVRHFWKDMQEGAQPCGVITHGGPLRLMQGMVHGGPGSLLAPSPPLGSVRVVEQGNPLFTTGRSEPRIPSRLPLHQERRRSVRQAATVQGGT